MNAPEAQQAFFKDLVVELPDQHHAEFFRNLHEAGINPNDVERAYKVETDPGAQISRRNVPVSEVRNPGGNGLCSLQVDFSRIPRSCGVRRNRI